MDQPSNFPREFSFLTDENIIIFQTQKPRKLVNHEI